ncbi:3258_t:CDS:2 [Paraglomus occultum]|uniref:3258_t:CDS:1 n=1 Tax=Paraglomus occultum TaxID=144539 RepID=A0A9N9AIF4_9GLOM|nr:3258_t:CDS:2 [Paraglomus occultum]
MSEQPASVAQNPGTSLKKKKTVMGPRPLPTIPNTSQTQIHTRSDSSGHTSTNTDNNTYQSNDASNNAIPPFPPLIAPKPHRPVPTVQDTLDRSINEGYLDNANTSIASQQYQYQEVESHVPRSSSPLGHTEEQVNQQQIDFVAIQQENLNDPYLKLGNIQVGQPQYSQSNSQDAAQKAQITVTSPYDNQYLLNNNGLSTQSSQIQPWSGPPNPGYNGNSLGLPINNEFSKPNNLLSSGSRSLSSSPNNGHLQPQRPRSYSPGYSRSSSPSAAVGFGPDGVPVGPDGTPLPPALAGGNRLSWHSPRSSPEPNSRMSMFSTNSRASYVPGLRLAIDEKNARRMTKISFTLASDEAALERYRDAARKTNDPKVQADYAKFLIEMSESYQPNGHNNSNHLNVNRSATYDKLVDEAVYWIDKLAKINYGEALYIKGTWYEKGIFKKEQNHDKALRCYRSASIQDHAKANYKLAENYEKKKDYPRACQFYKKAASLGDPNALTRMTLVFMTGSLRQEVDYKQALIYLKQAAAKANEDCPEGAYIYGMMLAKEWKTVKVPDDLVTPDHDAAREYIQRAAHLGYPPALYKMGVCHEYGALGCPYDPTMSVQYYERAAEKGEVEANMALSKWYLCGAEGYFEQNEALAYQHAEKAASKGLPAAEFAMGYFHEVGVFVQADLQKANAWYTKAAAHGNVDAKSRLGRGGTITRREHEEKLKNQKLNNKKEKKDKDCCIQ